MNNNTLAIASEKELARRLRLARIDKGLKQSDVTRLLKKHGADISTSAYAKLERGERGIGYGEAVVLASILDIDLPGVYVSPQSSDTAWALISNEAMSLVNRTEDGIAQAQQVLQQLRGILS